MLFFMKQKGCSNVQLGEHFRVGSELGFCLWNKVFFVMTPRPNVFTKANAVIERFAYENSRRFRWCYRIAIKRGWLEE